VPAAKKKGFLEKAAEEKAQKTREDQKSPYNPDGTPREGYKVYIDKTGTQRIVKENPGFIKEKSHKEAIHQVRVQESLKVEEDMRNRSTGPSTRIPEKPPVPEPRPIQRTTQLPRSAGESPVRKTGQEIDITEARKEYIAGKQ
jgi:hypothetical protein